MSAGIGRAAFALSLLSASAIKSSIPAMIKGALRAALSLFSCNAFSAALDAAISTGERRFNGLSGAPGCLEALDDLVPILPVVGSDGVVDICVELEERE